MADAPETLRRELRFWDLVFINISAVAGVRWLATAAHAGSGSVFLWLLATVTFFIPSALVVSALSERFPEEGGLYIWVKNAFGNWSGFLTAWFYFASNILYFPAMLLAGVSITGAIMGSENPVFAVPITCAILWLLLFFNLLGLRFGKWPGVVGGVSTYVTALILVGFALVVYKRVGSATTFHVLPQPTWDSVGFWAQIAFSMTGLELGAILGGEIKNPKRNIPRAAWISGVGIASFYIAGTAAMLVLLSPEQVSPVTGLAQAGQIAALRLSTPWIAPAFALLVVVGLAGQLGSFITGNTRLPYVIGLDSYLPPAFARLHPRWKTPYVSILSQGVLATLFLVATQLGESLRGAYLILVDMDVVVLLIPFVFIFSAGFKFGQRIAGAIGAVISAVAVILSLFPPPDVRSVWLFEVKLMGGCLLFALLGRLIFVRSQHR
jgi:amino acid transporter